MAKLLEHNFREIESLNQRGGRTLSIIDLVAAGTLSVEMAAQALYLCGRGASMLTGAVPGGAGKTTLLSCLLNALPGDVELVTVDDPRVLDRADEVEPGKVCFLVHEIGSGHWYGYLWGPPVARCLELATRGHLVASCLHADTREELTEILAGPPLGASEVALGAIDLMLFMHVAGGRSGRQRRVATMWQAQEGEHRLLWEWEAEADAWRAPASPTWRDGRGPEELQACEEFVRRLLHENVIRFEQVRRETLGLHRELGWEVTASDEG